MRPEHSVGVERRAMLPSLAALNVLDLDFFDDCGGVDGDTQRNVLCGPGNNTSVATGSLTGKQQKASWTSCASRFDSGPQSLFMSADRELPAFKPLLAIVTASGFAMAACLGALL